MPDWNPGRYKLRVTARPAGRAESIEQTVTLRRSWQLMLTSDKPVYQPGQVIHVRSLALARPQAKPVAGQEVVYSITDPKGNVIFRKRDVTSRFGIASTDCPLADEIVEGPYQLRCELGDTTSTITVEVKKYVLPKFKIAVELDEPYYQPGQKVHGTLSARYFFGKPLPESAARIEVLAVDVATGRFADKIAQTAVKTDAEGRRRLRFRLAAVARRPAAGRRRCPLSAHGDGGGLGGTEAVGQRLANRHRAADSHRGHSRGGHAGRPAFPTPSTSSRPTPTAGRPRPGSWFPASTRRSRPTPWAPRRWSSRRARRKSPGWFVRTDAAGQSGRREVSLESRPTEGQFLVRTDKAVYDGGQTVHVLALGGGGAASGSPLFLDVIKDGQTMLTDTVPMANGRGEYQIDLPPQISGTLQLCAYRLGSAGPAGDADPRDLRPASRAA